MELFAECSRYFSGLQTIICDELEKADGQAKFSSDAWQKEIKNQADSGGGLTRVIQDGRIFEKGGVNFSEVTGILPAKFAAQLTGHERDQEFSATGISLVLHPLSPLIPTTHANYRYLEVGDLAWFGGGADLTPYYLDHEDAIHFHRTLKNVCDLYEPDFYKQSKIKCDQYFYLPHRHETRGIGGIFFDYLGRDKKIDYKQTFELVRSLGDSWCSSYLPIVKRHQDTPWTEQQRNFQLIRRGRYVEFNLLYDRGTKFGLETGGRTESILMSLPNLVHWTYDQKIPLNSPEAELITVLKVPRSWV